MRLFNSLTKKVEDIAPLADNTFRIYSCGPTVYDHIHIGNLSAFIYADTLRRTLSASGFKTTHAMNITDVDDKTIAASLKETSPDDPKQKLSQTTQHFEEIFLQDFASVGGDVEQIKFVRATENIQEMQDLIRELIDKGFAYTADDGIYFSIKAYTESGKKYGQLSNIDLSHSQQRIQNDEYDKSAAQDFAVWKSAKPSEPAWEFEIDGKSYAGRPGWHIECSAMSKIVLGQPFDIHTGGIDLQFPHHENEIAQSTAVTANPKLAQLFFHNQHLLIDGQKMSKSLNNFYTLVDVAKQGHDPLTLRLLVLQGHYRSQLNFSFESLSAAANRLDQLNAFADLKWQPVEHEQIADLSTDNLLAAMQDDLNTPKAWEVVSSAVSHALEHGLPMDQLQEHQDYLKLMDDLFGLNLAGRSDINDEQKRLLADRKQARIDSNWSSSDEFRARLEQSGLTVRDLPNHLQIWSRR